jgi:hypothetical protein
MAILVTGAKGGLLHVDLQLPEVGGTRHQHYKNTQATQAFTMFSVIKSVLFS